MDEAPSRVVILDAGSQYGKRIDRRVRELNIKSDLRPLGCPADEIRRAGYEAIIISGGPSSVLDENAPPFDEEIFRLGIPVLGICYGKQLMVKCCGGKIIKKIGREDGQCEVDLHLDSPIFKDLPKAVKVLLTHGDGMEDPPPGFDEIARQDATIVGIANHDAKLYGLQFHPEVDLTENGAEMMKNFLYDVAGIKPDYTMGSREQMCIDHIKTVVGDKKVLMLISGGIDSTVSALLLRKALPEDQLYAVFIDNGFMRKDEPDQVEANLKKLGINVKMVPAWNRFYFASLNHAEKENVEEEKPQARALSAVTDPEEKRHIIGDTFVEVAQEVMRELNLNPENTFLGQGTLRPDLIESASNLASSAADVIKTHHNDSELVRQWRKRGRVIEPLTDFHKDEVRNLGRDLGLSEEYCGRHPFPGPGLAIRIICAYEPFMGKDFAETQVLIKVICGLAQAKETDHALYHRVVTATSENERDRLLQISEIGFSGSLLPIRTVGVQGDGRSYSYCAALSCVQNFKVDWDAALFLARIIPKVCHNVNRVAYAFGGPIVHPVTDITPTYLTKIPLSLAREADAIAHEILREHDMYNHIAQMPVVVIPIQFDRDPANNFKVPPCARSIVLRPFLSKDFMTGRPAVPGKDIPPAVVADMGTILTGIAGVSRVLYDLTSKPPGTTEWE